MASSGLFENYEQDYTNISTSISRKLNTQIPQQQGGALKATLKTVERELKEANEILQGMEMELNSLPPSAKAKLVSRLKDYRSDYEKLKQGYNKHFQTADRDALLSGAGGAAANTYNGDDQRSRLLANTNRLQDASRRLDESHRIALETEQVGAATLTTLRDQRQQLERANDRLDEADSYIDRNVRLLKSMGKRLAANRVLTYVIIAALLFVIFLIIYIKLT